MDIIILGQAEDDLLGTTQVIIDPQLQGRIQQAVKDIRQNEPDILKDITHIYALHSGNFGEWHSDDPHAVFLNIDRIETEVQQELKKGLTPEQAQHDVVKQEIETAIREQTGKVLVHEHAHVEAPEKGEPFAKQREESYELKSVGLRNFCSTKVASQVIKNTPPNQSRFAGRERNQLMSILSKLGYSVNDDGSVSYSRDPVEKDFTTVWDAIDHEKRVIANNKALIETHQGTVDPQLVQTKRDLIALAMERLKALQLWNKTYGQSYPLPGYIVNDLGEGQYSVTKEADSSEYTVDVEQRTCSCPAGIRGKQCKHLKAILWKLT